MALPTIFVSHGGGPMFWMRLPPDLQPGVSRLATHFAELGKRLKPHIKSILLISAHWEAREFLVSSNIKPKMIYDYGGFPENTYTLQYPAPGNPDLAKRVVELLTANSIAARDDAERGFDHGVFVPLMKIFPEADIPVVSMSICKKFDVKLHQPVGKALAPLREEGVLIMASGSSYHNLGKFAPEFAALADQFDDDLTAVACHKAPTERELRWQTWTSINNAREAHPREEHLIPLFVASSAASTEVGIKLFSEPIFGVRLSAFQFGNS